MKFFDSHTHTNYEPLIKELPNILNTNSYSNLGMNVVGCDFNTSKLAIEQAHNNSNVYATIGIHPENANFNFPIENSVAEIEKLYHSCPEKIISIGECGLDYYRCQDVLIQSIQADLFIAQIELAQKLDLPVMMHIRDAHYDAIKIIKRFSHTNTKFIVHCFSANQQELDEYLKLSNCYFSVGGAVTFKANNDLRSVVKNIPLDRLIVETDAPWLSPVPLRGKTNYPVNVIVIIQFLANLYGLEMETLSKQIMCNVSSLFKLKMLK